MTTAKISALSKCDGTGITPLVAEKLWPKLGKGLMAVVELIVDEHSEDADGELGVKLVIGSIEPAEGQAEKHLRELARALYMRRNPQPTLDAPGEATVADILDKGRGHLAEMGATIS